MTPTSGNLTIEQLLPLIRAMSVQKIANSSERLLEHLPTGASLSTGISHEVIENSIHFRIDYQLLLKGSPEDPEETIGIFKSSVVVAYLTDNPPHEFWSTSAPPLLNSMAWLAGHPYLRQSISLMTAELNFPNITLGLLRLGATVPDSVTIADRVYPFNLNIEVDPVGNVGTEATDVENRVDV